MPVSENFGKLFNFVVLDFLFIKMMVIIPISTEKV